MSNEADLLRRAAEAIREPLTGDGLRALPIGSAVVASGGTVWVKYEDEQTDAEREWGRCDRVSIGGKFRDSAWLAKTFPRLIYRSEPDNNGGVYVADWLDSVATAMEHGGDERALWLQSAVAVARAYLNGGPP